MEGVNVIRSLRVCVEAVLRLDMVGSDSSVRGSLLEPTRYEQGHPKNNVDK